MISEKIVSDVSISACVIVDFPAASVEEPIAKESGMRKTETMISEKRARILQMRIYSLTCFAVSAGALMSWTFSAGAESAMKDTPIAAMRLIARMKRGM